MRTIAIIQARLDSTRLPGKVLLDINGHPLLWHVINRTRQAKSIDDLVVATTYQREDDPICQLAESEGISYFRGMRHPDDVLHRFYRCWKSHGKPEVIVRVSGDSPMIDPSEIDNLLAAFRPSCDYLTNAPLGYETLPDGLDCEVFTARALIGAYKSAKLPSEREHVTPLMRRLPTAGMWRNEQDYSHLRFCVDDPQDLVFARAVFAELGNDFAWMDVVNLLGRKPEIAALMGKAKRNEGYEKSLKEDAAS